MSCQTCGIRSIPRPFWRSWRRMEMKLDTTLWWIITWRPLEKIHHFKNRRYIFHFWSIFCCCYVSLPEGFAMLALENGWQRKLEDDDLLLGRPGLVSAPKASPHVSVKPRTTTLSPKTVTIRAAHWWTFGWKMVGKWWENPLGLEPLKNQPNKNHLEISCWYIYSIGLNITF